MQSIPNFLRVIQYLKIKKKKKYLSLFILHLIFDNAQPYADQMRNECITRHGIFTS